MPDSVTDMQRPIPELLTPSRRRIRASTACERVAGVGRVEREVFLAATKNQPAHLKAALRTRAKIVFEIKIKIKIIIFLFLLERS